MSGRRDVKAFFLACVIVAGVYGGLTAKVSILYIQVLPGAGGPAGRAGGGGTTDAAPP